MSLLDVGPSSTAGAGGDLRPLGAPPIETPAQAERERDNSRLPPNASYRDAPEWLGTKDAGSPADKPDPRVLDLTKE